MCCITIPHGDGRAQTHGALKGGIGETGTYPLQPQDLPIAASERAAAGSCNHVWVGIEMQWGRERAETHNAEQGPNSGGRADADTHF
jgi:hypothetical protein|mmetsp:Transcript_23468/g.40449  ORF Transcript_23468/g.40449 Transcript_23468/m.40449 type:complete len:87 (-) Transcript_23468:442-702(-)